MSWRGLLQHVYILIGWSNTEGKWMVRDGEELLGKPLSGRKELRCRGGRASDGSTGETCVNRRADRGLSCRQEVMCWGVIPAPTFSVK